MSFSTSTTTSTIEPTNTLSSMSLNKIEMKAFLSADGSNWVGYKHALKMVLKAHKLYHIIEPDLASPTATDDEKNAVNVIFANTMHSDQIALTLYSEDPQTAWSNLKRYRETDGAHRAVELIHGLTSSDQGNDKVSTYGKSIIDKTRELKSLCVALSADQIIEMIATASFLKGLSPSLDSFAVNAVGTDIKNIKLDVLIASAITEEQRQHNRDTMRGDKFDPIVVNSASSSAECVHCKRTNHPSDNCFVRFPHLRPSSYGTRNKPSPTFNKVSGPAFNKMQQQAKIAFANVANDELVESNNQLDSPTIDISTQYLSTIDQSNHCISDPPSSARWLVDTGATRHMCNNQNLFSSIKKGQLTSITFGGGSKLSTDLVGEIDALIVTDSGSFSTKILNVLYVPGLVTNLLSAKSLCEETQATFTLSAKGCSVQRSHNGKQTNIGYINYSNNLLPVMIRRSYNQAMLAKIHLSPEELWHTRLGHPNKMSLHQTSLVTKGIPQCKVVDHHCDACHTGKEKALPHAKVASNKSTEPLELIHADLSGPLPDNDQGYKYYVVFVDDCSGFCDISLLKRKSETLDAFEAYKARVENLLEKSIKSFRSDGGGEFISNRFSQFLRENGITRQKSAAESQEQNGRAERIIQSLNNITRCFLHHASLDAHFWPFAIQQAVFVKNRTATTVLNGKTPFELFNGKLPNLRDLRTFGCLAWGLIPKVSREGKYSDRSRKSIHLGRANEYQAYTLLDLENGKIFVSRNVTFAEEYFIDSCDRVREGDNVTYSVNGVDQTSESAQQIAQEIDDLQNQPISQPNSAQPVEQPSADQHINQQANPQVNQPTISQQVTQPPPTPTTQAMETSTQQERAEEIADRLWKQREDGGIDFFKPKLNADISAMLDTEARTANIHYHILRKVIKDRRINEAQIHLAFEREKSSTKTESNPTPFIVTEAYSAEVAAEVIPTPQNHKQAMSDLHARDWKQAEESEMNSLRKCGTYTIVPLPEGRQVIGCRWVYAIKRDQDGVLVKFKARLVALGYAQLEGIDFDETFSPVLRYATLRALIALAAKHKLHLAQMDVNTAYLNGDIDYEIFMKQPPGYEVKGKEDFVCKLNKGLYGLKQAGRLWYAKIDKELHQLGFTRMNTDGCAYMKVSTQSTIIIGLYVDDLLLLSDCIKDLNQIKSGLTATFEMKDLGDANYILGIRIVQDEEDGSISICQDEYIKQVVKRFGFEEAKPTTMVPMNPGLKLCKTGIVDQPEAPKVDVKEYQRAIGSLMYAMIGTRPDIAFAVGKLAQYSSDPRLPHREALDQVLRYLSRTRNVGLRYTSDDNIQEDATLTAFSDADWGGCLDTRRSTTAFLVKLAGALVNWKSKKQDSVTCSTCEAEYIAASDTSREILSWRMFFDEIGYDMSEPTMLYCDNQSAIALTKDDVHHQRTKHIDIRYHFIRELVARKMVKPDYLNTEDMVADLLTKPLDSRRHAMLMTMIGMVEVIQLE